MADFQTAFLAAWKWLLSFRKAEWDFNDYPVYVRRNPVPDPNSAWSAQIAKWPGPIGLGSSPRNAIAELRSNVEGTIAEIRLSGERQIRPGVWQPIRFAATKRVAVHETLMDEFVRKVLDMEPEQLLFISDQSSLHDFGDDAEVERMLGLIRSNFHIECSDIVGANIAAILERIDRAR